MSLRYRLLSTAGPHRLFMYVILTQALHNIALNFGIPHLNTILQSEGYKKMPDELKIRLIDELAKENVFVGLERKKKQPQ